MQFWLNKTPDMLKTSFPRKYNLSFLQIHFPRSRTVRMIFRTIVTKPLKNDHRKEELSVNCSNKYAYSIVLLSTESQLLRSRTWRNVHHCSIKSWRNIMKAGSALSTRASEVIILWKLCSSVIYKVRMFIYKRAIVQVAINTINL